MSAFLQAAKALKNQNKDSSLETVTTRGLELPFNIDEIFANQENSEHNNKLKEVFKFILENLEKENSKVTEVDIKMQSKFMEISQLKDKGEKLDKDIE